MAMLDTVDGTGEMSENAVTDDSADVVITVK